MKKIEDELLKYKINHSGIVLLSDKDGIKVFRVKTEENSYILKYFENDEHKREIEYYNLFNNIGIKTIDLFGQTNNSILLEDINQSKKYRLATKEDLEIDDVIIAIADYYRDLHFKGSEYLSKNNHISLYSELKSINQENIEFLKGKTNYQNEEFWGGINQLIDKINPYYERHKTVTYNDFFYDNLIVSKDLKEAFMFDYNLAGEGLKYFDVSNVIYGLNNKMKELFLKHYGEFSIVEKYTNDVVSHIIALISAYKKDVFPKWAYESREKLTTGEIALQLRKLNNSKKLYF